jgi:hypothetical protein
MTACPTSRPSLPAAALPTAPIAGTSTTATRRPAPLLCAPATRTTPTHGHGPVASIQGRGRAKSSQAHRRRSMTPARNLPARGRSFFANRSSADFQAWRYQRDSTAWKYAMWDAGKRFEPPSYGPNKPAHRFRKCPCGEVFDMHGPDDVFLHVPHITAAERGRRGSIRSAEK